MSDKDKMLKEMRALWKRDAALFDEIVKEYTERGSVVFPREKRRRVKRQKIVMDWVWASVEFLKWRDGAKVKPACEHLAKHMSIFNLYDTETGEWRAKEEPKPSVFQYHPDGEGEGLVTGEGVRQTYYAAKRSDDLGMASLILSEMKAAYEGRKSVLKQEILPPEL